LFRRRKKKGDDKEEETQESNEEYIHPSEKIVEKKMSEIRSKVNQIDPVKQVDISSIPTDLSDLEQEIQQEDAQKFEELKKTRIHGKKGIVRAKIKPEIKDILPVWVEKPFYYIKPPAKFTDRIEQWQDSWGTFLLQWADAKDQYIVTILDLMQEYPFKNPIIGKSLSKDQLESVGNYLVENKYALWKGKRKTHLRLFWEDQEQTAEVIFNYFFDRGQRYVGVFDLVDAKQTWSILPTEELYSYLIILVKNKKAQWADKKREMIYLVFPV
jgi:hypothetical protein